MGLRLTRRAGESIICSGGIRIVFHGPDTKNRACVEVIAPREVVVLREEIATAHDRHRLGHDALEPDGIPRRRRDGSIMEAGEA